MESERVSKGRGALNNTNCGTGDYTELDIQVKSGEKPRRQRKEQRGWRNENPDKRERTKGGRSKTGKS